MEPIDVSLSSSQAASTGSGTYSIGGNTYQSNPLLWVIAGVVGLVGLFIFLKLKK